MCVLENAAENAKPFVFRGEECGEQLLKTVGKDDLVYFHNLSYDIRFLARYGYRNPIQKGTHVKSADLVYQGKTIHFADSWGLISRKLSDFPDIFKIPDIQKELFPYNYYTIARIKKTWGVIEDAFPDTPEKDPKQREDDDEPDGTPKMTKEEILKIFNYNIDMIEGCLSEESIHFRMWKYAEFYCKQDINILKKGFLKF
jgi:hypothetical protein